MIIKYFDESGKELFPKYNNTSDLYYLDTSFKKPIIYHLRTGKIEDVAPSGNDSFQYQIEVPGFWCNRHWWVDEDELYTSKQEVYDKAIRLYQQSKIKYKVIW